jgi:actin-related protein 8
MESQLKFTTFSNIPNITTKAYSSDYLRSDGSYFLSAENYTADYAEQVSPDPTRVIILHPGSYWLRFGFASDAFPCAVPHVIARQFKVPVQNPQCGHSFADTLRDLSFPVSPATAEWKESFERAVAASEDDLKARFTHTKRRAVPSARQFCQTFNTTTTQQEPEVIADHNDPYRVEWVHVDEDEPSVVIGEHALNLSAEYVHSYRVRWPLVHKGLNTVDYASLQEAMGDLTSLWREAIRTELHIVLKEFRNYYVVLVIPDEFHRNAVAAMVDVLFTMNFKAVMVVQESPCATFAAGISAACVVDMGAQTTSIACIDEGMVMAGTKITLPYGQDVVTRYFAQLLLVRGAFPYVDFDMERIWDRYMMEELKERHCSLNEQDVALQIIHLLVRRPSENTRKYAVKIYDETFLAPTALFSEATLKHLMWERTYARAKESSGNYLTATIDDGTDDFNVQLVPLAPPKPKTAAGAKPEAEVDTPEPLPKVLPPQKDLDPAALATLPLDQAILRSIFSLSTEPHVKRALNNIMLTGGGSRLNGLANHLLSRLSLDPRITTQGWDRTLRILVGARELDPRILTWKGATVMARLDSSSDLWLLPQEWKAAHIRLLRDKVTFLW